MEKDISFISNSCLGMFTHSSFENNEYNQPFIGTLIPEDLHFLKLCENILHYINCEPRCDILPSNNTIYSKQVKGIWYNNPVIKIPYPIVHLDDIEIHCIHENDINTTLSTFKRRLERFKSIINLNNYKIFNIMTWTHLFTNNFDRNFNNNYIPYISRFLNNNSKNENILFVFLGPTNYIKNPFYIDDDLFSLKINRRIDNVNVQIDFIREANLLVNFIKNYLSI